MLKLLLAILGLFVAFIIMLVARDVCIVGFVLFAFYGVFSLFVRGLVR